MPRTLFNLGNDPELLEAIVRLFVADDSEAVEKVKSRLRPAVDASPEISNIGHVSLYPTSIRGEDSHVDEPARVRGISEGRGAEAVPSVAGMDRGREEK